MARLLFRDTPYNVILGNGVSTDQENVLHADYDAAQQEAADAALSQIELGNRSPQNFTPHYVSPTPSVLSAFGIWHKIIDLNSFDSLIGYVNLRELARAGSGYGRVAAAHGDADGLERAGHAVIGMGLRMCGDWSEREDLSAGTTLMSTLEGVAVASIGYSGLVKGETQLGNLEAAQQAQADYDALKRRGVAYSKAVLQASWRSRSLVTIDLAWENSGRCFERGVSRKACFH